MKKAFTLIELSSAAVLLGILATAISPNIDKIKEDLIKSKANEITHLIKDIKTYYATNQKLADKFSQMTSVKLVKETLNLTKNNPFEAIKLPPFLQERFDNAQNKLQKSEEFYKFAKKNCENARDEVDAAQDKSYEILHKNQNLNAQANNERHKAIDKMQKFCYVILREKYLQLHEAKDEFDAQRRAAKKYIKEQKEFLTKKQESLLMRSVFKVFSSDCLILTSLNQKILVQQSPYANSICKKAIQSSELKLQGQIGTISLNDAKKGAI